MKNKLMNTSMQQVLLPLLLLASSPAMAWQPLGTGVNGAVNALAIDTTNNILYVGGAFTTAGGSSANRVAKWDGNSWTALGTGTDATVNALLFNSPNLFAGGDFTTADGNAANYIAKWNGSAWSAMGGGTNGSVKALSITGTTTLYVGGAFDSITIASTPTTVGKLAKVTISTNTWTKFDTNGSSLTGSSDYANAIAAVTASVVYVGGYISTVGGLTNDVGKIAKWKGSNTWDYLGSVGTTHGVDGLSGISALKANGTISTAEVFVGGAFGTAANGTSLSANNIARWNNTATSPTWSALIDSTNSNNGVNDTVQAIALDTANKKLYAGGLFTKMGASGGLAKGTARWKWTTDTVTGTWSRLGGSINAGNGSIDSPAPVNALAVDADGNVYAGGNFTSTTIGRDGAGSAVTANNIAVYTSTDLTAAQWKLVSLPHYDANATVYSAFDSLPVSSYNNGSATADGWIVYKRDEATQSYVKLRSETLLQGRGYWVKSNGDATMDMDGVETPVTAQSTNTNCTSTKGCYIIELTAPVSGQTSRYNLLGNPFINRVQWANVRFEVGGTVGNPATGGTAYTPSAALTANIADKQFATYNGSAYSPCDDVTLCATTNTTPGYIKPMQGFWIKLLPNAIGQTVKLLVPKP